MPKGRTNLLQEHDENGTEEIDTLGHLWHYCKTHPHPHDQKVAYLHDSKGSFHPSEKNDALCRFLTGGAISEECSNLPDGGCKNVCSSRMSPPIPHPHSKPRYMWLAKCEHVYHLIDARLLPQEMDRIVHERTKGADDVQDKLKLSCYGMGRYYAAEHWIHSHLLVSSSCDFSKDEEFLWGYNGISQELEATPTFNFSTFVPVKNHYGYTKDANNASAFGSAVLQEYRMLYGDASLVPSSQTWFRWDFFNLRSDASIIG
jgi:hypothetical protein